MKISRTFFTVNPLQVKKTYTQLVELLAPQK